MADKYVVDGYSFQSEADAKDAKNEIEGIEYLKKRMNLKNPKSVYDIYDKVIEKQLFKTPIGYCFLRELQQILYASPEIAPESVKEIPVAAAAAKAAKKEKKIKEKHISIVADEQEKRYKNRMMNMVIFNIFLIIAIIVIIAMTNNSSNTNILNYRDRLEREYSRKEDELAVWAQQLKAKEQRLNEMEKENN